MSEMLPCTLRLPHKSKNPAYKDSEDGKKEDDPDYQRLSDFTSMMAALKNWPPWFIFIHWAVCNQKTTLLFIYLFCFFKCLFFVALNVTMFFFGIFILGLQCTSFCALPQNPIFSFYCNLMLQIWVHLSTLRHMWSGWCLKFLCWHTLLIFWFFFCVGTSFSLCHIYHYIDHDG